MKKCKKCKQQKNETDFHKNLALKCGLASWCKTCTNKHYKKVRQKNKTKYRKYYKERYYKLKEEGKTRKKSTLSNRKIKLKSKYGLTLDDYDLLLKNQNFECAICGKKKDENSNNLCIDHCHVTNKIRGLLCSSCNMMLGNALDNVEILSRGIDYLNRYSEHN